MYTVHLHVHCTLYTLRLLINIISPINFYFIINYLKGARGKKFFLRKQIFDFFTFNTGGHPWVSTKNFSPIGPAVWPAIYATYKYTNVLFYYILYLCVVLCICISLCDSWCIYMYNPCNNDVCIVYLLTYTILIYWITHSNIKYNLPQ